MRRHNQIKNHNKTNELTKAFVEEILKFNKAHNIVGRFTEKEINLLDVLDCESILPYTNSAKKILDIGSGAGLPGLIIAIHQPQTEVTMSEKNKKKAYFIKKTIRTLQLTNTFARPNEVSITSREKKCCRKFTSKTRRES